MDPSPKEPLFTRKELLLIVSLWVLYGAAILSMDPEWVGWAGPLISGGALVATDPPPFPVFRASPREVFGAASFVSLLSLATLSLVSFLRGEPLLGLFARQGKCAELMRQMRFARNFQLTIRRWKLAARALLPARRGSSIEQESWESHPPRSVQGRVTRASQRSRFVPRGL